MKVKLIGVDTPETGQPSKPEGRYGKQAYRFMANLLKGERVYVVKGPQSEKDSYGRTLAYVYRAPDGLFVNAEVIRQGYGRVAMRFPFKHDEDFRQLELFAKEAKKGLWGPAEKDPETASPAIQPDSDTVYVTRTRTKYHRESCRDLRLSKIPVSLKEARGRYEPCSRCNPPR